VAELKQSKKEDDSALSPVLSMLNMMQFGDSQFPSGSFAFSGGLETLFNDKKIVTPEHVYDFIAAQLTSRWNSLDRVALCHTYRNANNLDVVVCIDKEVDSLTLSEGLRRGSCRNGAALLGVHARLGTTNSIEYRQRLINHETPAHIAIVQGLVFHHCGLTEQQAQIASAHGVCSDLLGAAMRLGKLGHVHAQLIRQNLTLLIAKILDNPITDDQLMHSYLPLTEIAAMRHEVSEQRLFAN
tara:strand:+ start:80024 stop:80746 length:723 start_codon:yes stop_codon:yes gene_type:complete